MEHSVKDPTDLQVGDVVQTYVLFNGKLTNPDSHAVVTGFEEFSFVAIDDEGIECGYSYPMVYHVSRYDKLGYLVPIYQRIVKS